MGDVGRSGQACVVVECADDHAANARESTFRAAAARVAQIFHLTCESTRQPLFGVLQFRELPCRDNAAKIKTQLPGVGFHPHGVRPGSHLSDSLAPYAIWRAGKSAA